MENLKYPVKKVVISQPFGVDNSKHPQRKNFYKLFDNKHPGVDFKIPIGTKIFAAYPGIIVRKENHKGMGKVIAIRNNNLVFLYAHISKFKTKLGKTIRQRELIGLSGETGTACTEPHLHFEARDISKPALKEMVFNPPFGKQVKKYKNTFTYKVNNTNTKKSWISLSKLFFGTEKYWKIIRKANPNINCNKNEILPDSRTISIPNYL